MSREITIKNLEAKALNGDKDAIHELARRALETLSGPVHLHQQLADAQQKMAAARKNERNPVDTLTNLPARKAFNNSVIKEQKRVDRSKSNRSGVIIQIDLSGFKAINDDHGHAAGDKALENFGRIIKDFGLRQDDVVSRTGGDEFTIIMANTTLVKSEMRLKNLNKLIKKIDFQYEGKTLRFSARMGFAVYDTKTSVQEAIKHADHNQITLQRITTEDRKIRGLRTR